MKEFIQFSLKILIVLILSAYVLDFLYSSVYANSKNRNKVENVINTKNRAHDIIMMGSSRANNHFVSELFVSEGYNTYNYGVSGFRLQETSLLLQLMLKNDYKIKTLILEVDLNINSDSISEGSDARFMPYLKNNETISNHFASFSDYKLIYYIPFYRYIKYDPYIGFRELISSLLKKPSKGLDNNGFFPLNDVGHNMKMDIRNQSPKKNRSYEKIKSLCKENNIELIVLSTPVCENTKGLEYFDNIKKVYPEIINYEDVVQDDKYFSSCGHLNSDGAKLLTSRIIKDLFISKVEE